MALSFAGTEETKHFDRQGFKVTGRRMFATYLPSNHTANVFLTPVVQAEFCQLDSVHIYPVPNKWGERGATTFDLNHLERAVVFEALQIAYDDVRNRSKK